MIMQLRVYVVTWFSLAALVLRYEILPWNDAAGASGIMVITAMALVTIRTMLRRWGYR